MGTLLPAAAVAQAADISGDTGAKTLFGLADELLQEATVIRANNNTALAAARRANEMASAIASLIQEGFIELGSCLQYLEELERALSELKDELCAQKNKSYLSQLFNQHSNKARISELSANIGCAFDVLLAQLRLHTVALTGTLSEKISLLFTRAQEVLEPGHGSQSSNSESTTPLGHRLPRPHLYFGRANETLHVVDTVIGMPSGRVAILGGPSMGKTTLALAALHSAAVIERFGSRRYFVPCEGMEDSTDYLTAIAPTLGIACSDPKVSRLMLRDLLSAGPALLVLDNFESAWEAPAQRVLAEDMLQFFGSVENLSLIVTLRGRERPQAALWTRPFLPPLGPLPEHASKQTFLSIADVSEDETELGLLLGHLDDVPLAIVLMANLAQAESPSALLRRWDQVKTGMLVSGDGQTRLTSLDVSITVSLQSPRVQAVPSARSLLALLSFLPCGVADTDIPLWHVGHYQEALSVLIQCSLVARRPDDRIYVLAPIRSFVLSNYPPSELEIAPIYAHYFGLARLAERSVKYTLDADGLSAVVNELENIHAVVKHALDHPCQTAIRPAVEAVCSLCVLYVRRTLGAGHELLPTAVHAAESHGMDKLHADLIMAHASMVLNGFARGDAHDLYLKAHKLYTRCGHDSGSRTASRALTQFLKPDNAIAEFQRLFSIAESHHNHFEMALSVEALGSVFSRIGNPQVAITHFEHALTILQESGEFDARLDIVAQLKLFIADEYRIAGDLRRAASIQEEGLRLSSTTQHFSHFIRASMHLMGIQLLRGQPLEAIRTAEPCLALQRHSGLANCVRIHILLAEAHAKAGDADAASRSMDAVERLRPTDGWPAFERFAILTTRGSLALWRCCYDEARLLLGLAREQARSAAFRPMDPQLRNDALVAVALADAEQDGEKAAALALGAAAVLRGGSGHDIMIVKCLVKLAEVVTVEDDSFAERLVDAVLLPAHKIGLAHEFARALLCSAGIAQRRGLRQLASQRARNALRHFGQIKDERRLRVAETLV